ncbi:tRNA pseudouridine55 synthase [Granulicatella balaenopterae]|uniref:tRNA pseudouridine synthase B n=1 Tax=Granulicatella balaenopterae TaxID=137733 RepID=A0A1H9I2P2_9LACT|nr:tRNA pseudouridine(55) synthase TruB [Granulicatella balaenopterae]SEQ68880.1 tRNA pseudouridine55 synthase [Granulicatella balaenopterae]
MDGILPIWKEKGMTSFDCVFKLRKILKMKKIGHSGTLDPEVDGVLPICLGKGTKVVEYLLASAKQYKGQITLGFATETEDAHGDVIEKTPVKELISTEVIDQAMKEMVGELKQIPPMYSAVKVNGRRLYEYARKGEEVERPVRTVQIYAFDRTSEPVFDEVNQILSWHFEVTCSKGTYIRTLAVDLGRNLGYAAHMSQLTRIKSGLYKPEDCMTIDEVREAVEAGTIEEFIQPVETALVDFDKMQLPSAVEKKVANGSLLEAKELPLGELQLPIALYQEERVVAIYDQHPSKKGMLKPIKMF